jgi:hypothetical protein
VFSLQIDACKSEQLGTCETLKGYPGTLSTGMVDLICDAGTACSQAFERIGSFAEDFVRKNTRPAGSGPDAQYAEVNKATIVVTAPNDFFKGGHALLTRIADTVSQVLTPFTDSHKAPTHLNIGKKGSVTQVLTKDMIHNWAKKRLPAIQRDDLAKMPDPLDSTQVNQSTHTDVTCVAMLQATLMLQSDSARARRTVRVSPSLSTPPPGSVCLSVCLSLVLSVSAPPLLSLFQNTST